MCFQFTTLTGHTRMKLWENESRSIQAGFFLNTEKCTNHGRKPSTLTSLHCRNKRKCPRHVDCPWKTAASLYLTPPQTVPRGCPLRPASGCGATRKRRGNFTKSNAVVAYMQYGGTFKQPRKSP